MHTTAVCSPLPPMYLKHIPITHFVTQNNNSVILHARTHLLYCSVILPSPAHTSTFWKASLHCTHFKDPNTHAAIKELGCVQNASLKQQNRIACSHSSKPFFCTRLLINAKYFSTSINQVWNWSYLCSSLVHWLASCDCTMQLTQLLQTCLWTSSINFHQSRKLPSEGWCWWLFQFFHLSSTL